MAKFQVIVLTLFGKGLGMATKCDPDDFNMEFLLEHNMDADVVSVGYIAGHVAIVCGDSETMFRATILDEIDDMLNDLLPRMQIEPQPENVDFGAFNDLIHHS